jgi:hypothetical protein
VFGVGVVVKYGWAVRLILEGLAMNRAVLVVLSLFAISAIDARPSAGEVHRPWCVEYQGRDGATTCTFSSREQCMLTATPGTGGLCVQNPWYGSGGQQPDTTSRGERTRRR